jgi:glycosyltransferase involved in cell wall biosynthesis
VAEKIAYIMSRFPHLPETFILREMNALERHGWQICLYPLIRQDQSVIHEDARRWIERVRYVPFFSVAVLKENVITFLKMPLKYVRTWLRLFFENLSSLDFLMRSLAVFPKAVSMAARMGEEGVRHIHAHYATHPALAAWVIHQLAGISYSVTVHAHDIFVDKAMLKTKLEAAAFIVAISDFNRRYLAEHVGSHLLRKIDVIHCGIDPAWYQEKQGIRETLTKRLEIINVGSLQPYKGHLHLVEACSLLKERGLRFRCRIIGDGALHQRLERLIEREELQDDVFLLGALPQEEVAGLLPTADCYVQPSVITPEGKMEGIPVALMEAYAAGLPVIATNISGIPELVRPGETGFLVPPEDSLALADMIMHLHHHFDHARQLAKQGRELVLDQFDLDQNVQLLAARFAEVIRTEPLA